VSILPSGPAAHIAAGRATAAALRLLLDAHPAAAAERTEPRAGFGGGGENVFMYACRGLNDPSYLATYAARRRTDMETAGRAAATGQGGGSGGHRGGMEGLAGGGDGGGGAGPPGSAGSFLGPHGPGPRMMRPLDPARLAYLLAPEVLGAVAAVADMDAYSRDGEEQGEEEGGEEEGGGGRGAASGVEPWAPLLLERDSNGWMPG